jgi:uncharacterized protein YndB with AHSA1/START domain
MNQPIEKIEVRVQVTVNTSAEKAFETFTRRCHDWWPAGYRLGKSVRTGVTIEPIVGGRWYETGDDGSECDWGKVLVWDPPRQITFAWQISPDFTPEINPNKSSRVDVRFTQISPGKTVIELVHSELERHGDNWMAMHESVSREGGWADILKQFSSLAKQLTT